MFLICLDCNAPLIWGQGGVGGEYMSSSSYKDDLTPDKAELSSNTGYFRSDDLDVGNYLQVFIFMMKWRNFIYMQVYLYDNIEDYFQ